MSALGNASYAVVIGLLSKMEERGVLARADVIDILDGALGAIEDIGTDDADVRLARKALEKQIQRWRA